MVAPSKKAAASGGKKKWVEVSHKATAAPLSDAPQKEAPCVYTRDLLLKAMEKHLQVGSSWARMASTASTEAAESTAAGSPLGSDDDAVLELLPRTRSSTHEEVDGDNAGPRRRSSSSKRGSVDSSAAALGKGVDAPAELKAEQLWQGATTVMIRNIPNQYTRELMCKRLKELGFEGKYDFLYLPGDRASDRNMGYAFVNMRTAASYRALWKAFHGVNITECLPGFKSNKVCDVRVAEVQGRTANFERWCCSGAAEIFAGREQWQPIFLDDEGREVAIDADTIKNARNARRQRQRAVSWHEGLVPSPALVPYLFPLPAPWAAAAPWPEAFLLPPTAPAIVAPTGAGRGAGCELHAELRADAPEFKPVKADDAGASAVAKARAVLEARVAAEALTPHELLVRAQVEYYFSVANIAHDLFLRSLMDARGWVAIDRLVQFPKLQRMMPDAEGVAKTLRGSAHLAVSRDGRRVRIRNATLRESFPRTDVVASPGTFLRAYNPDVPPIMELPASAGPSDGGADGVPAADADAEGPQRKAPSTSSSARGRSSSSSSISSSSGSRRVIAVHAKKSAASKKRQAFRKAKRASDEKTRKKKHCLKVLK